VRRPAATSWPVAKAGEIAAAAIRSARAWLAEPREAAQLQASARRLAMTLGRGLELALLVEHAQWQLDKSNDRSGIAPATRFAGSQIDQLHDELG
jgi:hypothetical protein